MRFEYRYHGSSAVAATPGATSMSFVPDAYREPTYFDGKLNLKVPFREAISALHAVVVSDHRFQARDTTAYKEWAAQRELEELGELAAGQAEAAERYSELAAELRTLRGQRNAIMGPFYKAQREYFQYLYRKNRDFWWVLDPVITVHPDQVFFECFSRDESSYGRLGCGYEVFDHLGDHACGTTNVDYSMALYQEFQKIRGYKETRLQVDPSGFEVETTGDEAYKEVKIDLPESWVRGFLQVSSAMTLPMRRLELHPMDVHNLCFLLRRKKERNGPRSLRFLLTDGEPVRVLVEPWNHELICPRSIYQGQDDEIRLWGRRRLHILERLIPVARRFVVHLLGTGMPSFFVADLGDMSFTLGLSGWTRNDWSRVGNFDLMAARTEVDSVTQRRVFDALRETWVEDTDDLALRLRLDRSVVLGALQAYAQAGRAIYDLEHQAYRVRELTREPLPVESLRFANEREAEASKLVATVEPRVVEEAHGRRTLEAVVADGHRQHQVRVQIDADERLVDATCECSFFFRNKLFQGPCCHILALRMADARRQGSRT
ncbi:MAG: SWIM zinc finger domain-containing protein [Thermoanaerobaculia bacterium]|nr:SWIM zinc finger domain-containing protein [Thermoanaerobaculia bacterium]